CTRGPMRIVDLQQQTKEEWRSGVMTRMKASAVNNATQLCMFEQWCDPGHGAPTHLHAVEEVLCVREGTADVWIDDEHVTLTSGQLVIVPAGCKHGLANAGKRVCSFKRKLGLANAVKSVLYIESNFASPVFEAAYEAKRETPRRCLPVSEAVR